MSTLIRFFASYSPLVYMLLILGGILALRRMWKIWSENRDSFFDLEREMSRRRMAQAISSLVMVVLLAVGELVLSTIIAPSLPASDLVGTPTINPLSVPAGQLSPELATQIAGSPAPTAAGPSSSCVPGQIMITSPADGQTVSGQIQVQGTANIPSFGFYKYEVALRNTDIWTTILAGRQTVVNGDLGAWNTKELTPGDYLLRLVVLDTGGNAYPPCIVSIRIKS